MKIPKSMGYGRSRVKVEQPKFCGRGGIRGEALLYAKLIRVARYTKRNGVVSRRSPNERSETLWHELTHTILHAMGHPLHTNEKFVTEFAKRLNGAIINARF